MNFDLQAASPALVWVEAMFIVVPVAFAGLLLGVWWYQRKKRQEGEA